MSESSGTTHFPDEHGNINDQLAQLDSYIYKLVQQHFPRHLVSPDALYHEIEDIVQNTRIKFWRASLRISVYQARAYIRMIVKNECIDFVRRSRKRAEPLPINEEGEVLQGNILLTLGEGMHDPAEEVEQLETVQEHTIHIAKDVLTLPKRQQQATICDLKGHVDDMLSLTDAFHQQGADITEAHWPTDKAELQRLKASLSVAHNKLEALRHNYV
jgi:RNA polymerase sigma factor (sigma-70 family)